MERARFLFAMWEGGGTGPPELAVASRLVARGHAVTVIADPSLEEDVRRAGARFTSWKDAPHRNTRTRESEIVRDWAAFTPIGAFARARDRHAFRPAHLFAREVVAAFEANPADIVVVDALLFGALVGAEATGAKVVALIPMTSFLPAPGRPPASMGLLPAASAMGRARDRVIESLGKVLIWRSCLPHLNFARESVGLAPVAHPLDQLRRADRVLVQTSAWFDFDAPPSHENVRYVGPELGDPTWASAAVVDESREPLVLVAFSTTYMGHEKLLSRIIRAFAGLPARAIVTTGPSIDPRAFDAPPNVTVLASAPHAEIMRRASLVVTHGGHGTLIRALAYGVPVLCMPLGRDQGDNAARAKHIGAGITLSRHAGTSSIRRAITHALDDERLHASARHAREEIANETRSDVIEELEALVTRA